MRHGGAPSSWGRRAKGALDREDARMEVEWSGKKRVEGAGGGNG